MSELQERQEIDALTKTNGAGPSGVLRRQNRHEEAHESDSAADSIL
jgi:hypothetical protein